MTSLRKQYNASVFSCDELKRLLKDYNLKYAIALHAWLWFPYADEVEVSIAIHKKGEKAPELIKVQTGRPLNNKAYMVARAKFGKTLSNGFFPIVFESFEELEKVEKITIIWNIANGREFSIAEYDVSFKKPKQNGVYGLASSEFVLDEVLDFFSKEPSDDVKDMIKSYGLDETKVIVKTSMYDDVYIMTHHDSEMELMAEFHTKDSKHSIEAFETDNKNDLLPFGITSILVKLLANELKNGNENVCVPVTYYHSAVELDDERILHC